MTKLKLTIDVRKLHDFSEFAQLILIKSGLFDVESVVMPEYDQYLELRDQVYGRYRHCHGGMAFIRINGELIIIDTQYEEERSHEFHKIGLFSNMRPKLYVKMENDKAMSLKLGCPVRSWVQFPAGWHLVDKFKWGDKRPLRTAILVSSKNSLRIMNRTSWFSMADKLETFDTAIGIKQSEYLKHLSRSKWGVILSRDNDHNTREYEFISNHVPMALNYWPECNFPFYPNEHFLFVESPRDLKKLMEVDPEPFHKQSEMLWNTYFRPDSASKWLCGMAGISI